MKLLEISLRKILASEGFPEYILFRCKIKVWLQMEDKGVKGSLTLNFLVSKKDNLLNLIIPKAGIMEINSFILEDKIMQYFVKCVEATIKKIGLSPEDFEPGTEYVLVSGGKISRRRAQDI